MDRAWAGVDIGKRHHHAVVVDAGGEKVLSRRVTNDELDLLALIGDVSSLATEVTWAIDLHSSESALLVALLLAHGQKVVYVPGMAVNRAASSYRGAGKTDAKDAYIIADQARMRRDLAVLRADEELIVELRMLVASRQDLVSDRTRAANRLHDRLLAISPALERALDLRNQGPLVLLTGFQTPAALREAGVEQVTAWLRDHGVRSAAMLAAASVQAAETQITSLPGEQLGAQLVARLAEGVMALDEQIKEIDQLIEDRFRRHPAADVIASFPGIGILLGAEFLAATGGDMDAFGSADRLASLAGVAPVPRDSGRVSGNLHRPRRYHRGLQRVFYTSALISIRCNPNSRRFYDRKRAEGKRHTQAVLALARRRVNVLWVLLREGRCYELKPPQAQAA
ncbi:IS110 family transposase [Saccharomonospora sp. NPDC046836]|uniref:IS110 family transposase n=1 Tax=Saccharomonospora sp. NPDC046836 TaxID=3156921 RepID=UPI0033FB22EA